MNYTFFSFFYRIWNINLFLIVFILKITVYMCREESFGDYKLIDVFFLFVPFLEVDLKCLNGRRLFIKLT